MIFNRIEVLINWGVSPDSSPELVKKIRLVNVTCLITTISTPLLFLYLKFFSNDQETWPVIFYSFVIVLSLVLNKNKKYQLALLALVIGGIITTYFAMIVNDKQIPAPYFNILFGLATILFVDNKLSRILVSAVAFLSFFIQNGYQIKYRSFSLEDYMPVLAMLLLILVLIFQFNKEHIRNIKVIKKQTDDLLFFHKKQHEQELLFKQKETESVISNNQIQLQLKQDLIDKLKKIKTSNSIVNELQIIIVELQQQNELQRNMNFLDGDLEKLNSLFFNKLQLKHPKITRTDKEFCIYIKLAMTSKEIALIRNTTVNTVNVAKTRLRKKLGLKRNQDTIGYLLSL